MSTGAPSTVATAMTWLAVTLAVVMLALGTAWYGISLDVHRRFWADIADRLHGPMTFRFYLQPAMAVLAAIPDGIRDARTGHKSFLWSSLWDSNATTGRLTLLNAG